MYFRKNIGKTIIIFLILAVSVFCLSFISTLVDSVYTTAKEAVVDPLSRFTVIIENGMQDEDSVSLTDNPHLDKLIDVTVSDVTIKTVFGTTSSYIICSDDADVIADVAERSGIDLDVSALGADKVIMHEDILKNKGAKVGDKIGDFEVADTFSGSMKMTFGMVTSEKYETLRSDVQMYAAFPKLGEMSAMNEWFGDVLVGPSGSGKSTLLYMLSALRKPTGGSIPFNGKIIDTDRIAERTRAEKFGFIFQRHFLIPYLTVMENVRMGTGSKTADRDIKELLDRLSIADLADKKPFQMSGGQCQRAAIARALIKKPSVIFADEPTASLDRTNADNIYSLLRECADRSIVIIATHDISLLAGDEDIYRIADCKVEKEPWS